MEKNENTLTKKLVNHIYDMAKLSVGGLNQKEIVNLQLNNAEVISGLLKSVK